MNVALLIFILAFGWALATGDFSILNLMLGAMVGGAALFLIRSEVSRPKALSRLRRLVSLAGLFVYELMQSALRVGLLVLRPGVRTKLTPGIVAFPLTVQRPAEITLLANLITLTPGTLSVDVSEDRRLLYVHAIDVKDRDALINDIATGFERKIIEAFHEW
jgi:multicomponent Na+:H+ antiporter subunit E